MRLRAFKFLPKFSSSLCAIILATSLSSSALAKDDGQNLKLAVSSTSATKSQTDASLTKFFEPNPTQSTNLDFDIWSDWLEANVLFMGPSRRQRAPSAFNSRSTGSRFISGHRSRYRHEGNKIPYRTMQNEHKEFLEVYQKDLEHLSERIDITALSRNDQLAYWFNLHNVAIINQIASNYPLRTPDKIEPIEGSSDRLHDAKILKVMGQNLSLRDIREKIVYQHWQDPIVIYGFHHGNMGGPNIALGAYEGDTVQKVLEFNAIDFTNSLRGFSDGKISPIYKEAAPFLFPKGAEGADRIRPHLKRFLRPELVGELSIYETLKWHKPIRGIADLAGGQARGSRAGIVLLVGNNRISNGTNDLTPTYVREFLSARDRNIQTAKKRGWLASGQVIIVDIDTSSSDPVEIEVK